MSSFIVTGDWHFRGVNPRARLDNFQESLTNKIMEVFQLAIKHQAKGIIVAGDVFDSPGTALGTIAELGRILQNAPCPVLAIPGNHDLWAGNQESKYRTPYGLMAQLGLLWDLIEEPYELFGEPFDSSKDNVALTGHSFTVETDTMAGALQFMPPRHANEFSGTKIHVVHSMLMDQAPGFEMRHTLISQVNTDAQVIISGHEHLGFGIKTREDGVMFINPGALCRLSAHTAEMDRQIQVALLKVSEGKVSAELIPLRCALPGYQVLSREHIEAENEREKRMDKFLSLLASEGESKFLEVRDIVEDLAARENLPPAVKDEALKRIGEAREKIAG